MKLKYLSASTAAGVLSPLLLLPAVAQAAVVANPTPSPQCGDNKAFYNPTLPPNIVLPPGFTASVFAAGLNMPTGIAFRGDANNFEVYVLESGHGIPSVCNDQSLWPGGEFATDNPFTPDILVFNKNGRKIRGPLGKPTSGGGGFQPEGPAIDISFVRGFDGGRLFATDSNQSTHQHNGQNNSSRIIIVNPMTGQVTPFITNLPTGDHPTEQLAFRGDGWIYWSQGSTTNSGVVGLDNGGGLNQQDIPCQDITLSKNVFESTASTGSVFTSGYSPFGTQRPGATVKAFESAMHRGVCDGAILRAPLNAAHPENAIEPFSWGYRNPYAIRFPPKDHPLSGGILAGMDGADERGNRPSDNAPDELHLGRQNSDGSPDYHGWPDRYGGLPTSQRVYNPIGGPNDDVCPPPFSQPTCLANLIAANAIPMRDVLAGPPQQITGPLANEGADSSFTGIDFVPDAFVGGPVQPGAVLYSLEGDFGFSPPNSDNPAAEIGHEVKLINFNQLPDTPLALRIQRFASNTPPGQAFVQDGVNGFNRPTNLRFGPDGCAYVVDYGAVRDLSADSHFVGPPANGPLVQIPGTGAVWKICPSR
jgi:glucose/arabinose dehydrogenase